MGFQVVRRDAAAAVLLQARRRRQRRPGPRRVRPGGLRGRQDRHGEDQDRHQVLAAGRPRGHVEGRQVRDRARLLQHGQQRLRGRLLRRPRGREGRRQAGHRRSRASRRRTTTTIVFKLTQAAPAASLAGALALPLSAPVPEEYAEKFDAENPSHVRPEPGRDRPVHDRERRVGQGDRLRGRPPHPPRPQPELGRRAPTTGPAYLDEIEMPQGNDDTTVASRKILDGESMINGDFSPPTRRSSSRSLTQQEGPARARAERRRPLHRDEHDDQAVRRRQRAAAVIAGFDREAMRLTRGGELIGDIPTHFIPPELPGFEEAGGLEGPGIDFMSQPRRRRGAVRRVLQEGGLRLRQVRGRRASC